MTQTLGSLIDQLHDLREEKRRLAQEEKRLNETYNTVEAAILERLNESDTTASRGQKASVSITENEIATLTDFDALVAYIVENDAWHLLHRRVASRPAIEEITSNEAQIPGVEIVKQTKLGLRSL